MNELSVFYDFNHSKPVVYLEPYLLLTNPSGLFFELHSYKGLENELRNYSNSKDFIKNYKKVMNYQHDPHDCVYTVLDFVIKNNTDFWAVGIIDNEMKNNIKLILNDNEFEGVHSFITGLLHKDFVESELVPLFKSKFEKITFY